MVMPANDAETKPSFLRNSRFLASAKCKHCEICPLRAAYRKRYYMTGNDVTYTYGTSGRTEDGAAQSERRANSFVFPSQSNVGVANPMKNHAGNFYEVLSATSTTLKNPAQTLKKPSVMPRNLPGITIK